MIPFVVDANAINIFQQERVAGQHGVAHNAVASIFLNDHIALDLEQLCYQEWIDCAGGKFPLALTDWVSDQLVSGKIKLYNLSANNCRKHLLQVGLPKADHKWVRLALGCGGNKLVTEDIDFFDPSLKSASSIEKADIKARRAGRCSRELRIVYGLMVFCLCHVPSETTAPIST